MDSYQERFGDLTVAQALGRILRAINSKYAAEMFQHADMTFGVQTGREKICVDMIARLLDSDGVHDLTSTVPEIWDSIMALSERTGEDVSWLTRVINTTPLKYTPPTTMPESLREAYLKFRRIYQENPIATIDEIDKLMEDSFRQTQLN